MPLHNYECEFCGHVFEELIFRDAAEDELVCPRCGATRPKRRMSAPAKVSSFGGGGGPGSFTGGTCGTGGG